MTLFKKAAVVTTGLVTGGLVSFMVVNAAFEGKRGNGVFTGHEEGGFYALDAGFAIACAGISYVLASCYKRAQTEDVFIVDSFRRISRAQEPSDQVVEPSTT